MTFGGFFIHFSKKTAGKQIWSKLLFAAVFLFLEMSQAFIQKPVCASRNFFLKVQPDLTVKQYMQLFFQPCFAEAGRVLPLAVGSRQILGIIL